MQNESVHYYLIEHKRDEMLHYSHLNNSLILLISNYSWNFFAFEVFWQQNHEFIVIITFLVYIKIIIYIFKVI